MSEILTDGYPTTLEFSADSDIYLLLPEKEVMPPGIDLGGAIATTTMRNSAWRTQAPRTLKTLTNCTFSAAYDPAVYDAILALIGVETQITITFSDGSTLAFYGWLESFTPANVQDGTQPTADVIVVPSNSNAGTETAPSYTAAS